MIKGQLKRKGEQLAIKSATTLTERVMAAAGEGLAAGLLIVVGMAQREYLSGPRPTHIQSVSGRLRGGMESDVTVDGQRINGRIGNSIKYAAFHEFGFHGTINIRAHTRAVSQVLSTGAEVDTRRRVVSDKGEFLGFRDSRKRASGKQRSGFVGVAFVRAHARKVNYAGKPYTKPALEKGMPQVITEINDAMGRVTE